MYTCIYEQADLYGTPICAKCFLTMRRPMRPAGCRLNSLNKLLSKEYISFMEALGFKLIAKKNLKSFKQIDHLNCHHSGILVFKRIKNNEAEKERENIIRRARLMDYIATSCSKN